MRLEWGTQHEISPFPPCNQKEGNHRHHRLIPWPKEGHRCNDGPLVIWYQNHPQMSPNGFFFGTKLHPHLSGSLYIDASIPKHDE